MELAGNALAPHITAFILARSADGLAEGTISWYEWSLGQFVKYVGDSKIDREMCQVFIADLRARELSAYTVRNFVRVLKTFFRWCVNEERTKSDPAAALKIPKLPKRVPRGISIDDLRVLLNHANTRDRAVLLLLIDCGLRVSELSNLRLSDCDFERGIITVCGKGSQERFAFLANPTKEATQEWLAVRNSTNDFLFVGVHGEPFKKRTVTEILRRLKNKTKVGRCNPHSFRHAFAREFLLSGGDLASLSSLLGHSDLDTTMIYSVFTYRELKEKHTRHSPVAVNNLRN